MAHFAKEVNPGSAELTSKFSGGLPKLGLTSLAKIGHQWYCAELIRQAQCSNGGP